MPEMPKAKAKERPSLERKIYFFRSSIGKDASGSNVPFDAAVPLGAINRLPFDDDGGRYIFDQEGNALCAWIDGAGQHPRMRFSQIRRVGLPQIDAAGNLTDLNLQTFEGLVEPVHVVFFRGELVGVEFNFYGPRPSRLGYYLQKTAGLNAAPVFDPLLRLDVAAQLERLWDIRLFDLKVHSSYASALKKADADLGATFDAAANDSPEEVQVVLRARKQGAGALLGRLKAATKSLLRRPDLRTEASHFVIKGLMQDSGRVEPLDLLRDQLISHKRIIRVNERSRALDKDAAYAAITQAFDELSGELADAAGGLVVRLQCDHPGMWLGDHYRVRCPHFRPRPKANAHVADNRRVRCLVGYPSNRPRHLGSGTRDHTHHHSAAGRKTG